MRWGVVFALTILFAQSTVAWSPETQKYLCEEAVIEAWGANTVIECLREWNLSGQGDLCETIEDEHVRDVCLSLEYTVHPSNMPDLVFNDTGKYHIDYFDCPIRLNLDRKYLCGDTTFRPAIDRAQQWFTKAGESTDKCLSVRLFCVGANYLAGRAFPPNRVKSSSVNDCESGLKNAVEKWILRREDHWTVKEFCRYEYQRPFVGQMRTSRYSQDYTITEKSIEAVIGELASQAEDVIDAQALATTSTVETTVTPITPSTSEPTSSVQTTLAKPNQEDVGETEEGRKTGGSLAKASVVLVLVVAAAGLLLRKKHRQATPALRQR